MRAFSTAGLLATTCLTLVSGIWAVPAIAQTASPTATSAAQGDNRAAGAAEIIVTAQKKSERLIDTPLSVTTLSTNDLAKTGVTQLRDIAASVPGLSLATTGTGQNQISLRGVTVGADISPTTAVYVDDVPYGSSTNLTTNAQLALDAGPFDLQRIEILRGPQGTLYGASAIGGLIKYVTTPPDPSALGFRVLAGTSFTEHGGVNYDTSVTGNIPLSDKAAIRVTAYESHDGGYYDNVLTGKNDVNRSDVYGGRVELLLKPTESLTIRLSGATQDISRAGDGTADYELSGAIPFGALGQSRFLPEPFTQQFRVGSASIAYDFGPAKLTSITSYQSAHTTNLLDVSDTYVPILAAFLNRDYKAIGFLTDTETKKFAQEIRLASNRAGPIEWLVGGYFTNEDSHLHEAFNLLTPAGIYAPNDVLNYVNPSTYREYAAFGNATWHINDRFDISAGARYSDYTQITAQVGSGIFVVPAAKVSIDQDVVTYLANARYHFDQNAMAYFRFATGYRPGGPNYSLIDPSTGKPSGGGSFQPDDLKSYELGYKAETPDRRFGVDLAVYYIDWANIQLNVIRGGFGAVANAPGGATIKGVELTLDARPIPEVPELAVTGTLAYTDATLAKADTDLGGAKGESLPFTPKYAGNINVDYVSSAGHFRPTFGATLRMVSNRTSSFNKSTSDPQYHLPAYTTVDFRAGVQIERDDGAPIDVQFYVRNAFDSRGQQALLYPNLGARVAIIQPRTIGMSVATKF